MSAAMGRDKGRRFYFLSFGSPAKGKHAGNTPAQTHKLLRLLDKAMENKKYHQDGGWKYALQA
jgi:hypothetical protein